MRIAIAQVWQETHTFCPIPTGMDEFEQGGLYFGDEILEKLRGVGEIGGFLAMVQADPGSVELIPIIRAWAMSGGRVTTNSFEFFKNKLVEGLQAAAALDGVFVSMHGASASESEDDLEGELLSVIRNAVGEHVPMAVSLDHHANITRLTVESADVIVGYQTQPHDPFETGERAANLLLATIKGDVSPTMAWQKIPMLAPADRGSTAEWPMQTWFNLAREMEQRPGVLSVSNFPVQPWLDVPELGWTALAITDNDPALAGQLVAELANKAWEMRHAFWEIRRLAPKEVVRRADAAEEGLIVICDASDSVLSGVPGDSTCLLQEMINQEIDGVALVPMVDPDVVEAAIRAGIGNEITVYIGGKMDEVFGKPILVTGRVAGTSETGLKFMVGELGSSDMGRTVRLDVGNIKLIVSEFRGIGGTHPDIYRHFGIDPAEAKMVVVKTYFHYQHFGSMVKEAFMADCPGLSTWDLRLFEWKRAPRPVFPLDDLMEWHATP